MKKSEGLCLIRVASPLGGCLSCKVGCTLEENCTSPMDLGL